MDEQRKQDEIHKRLNKYYEFLKRTTQFVFSVFVFSLFVWYSSGFSVLPGQSFTSYYISTCLLTMLAHTLERKYMFLICNAILAFFLAKTSLFFTTSSSSASPPYDLQTQFHDDQSQTSNDKAPVSEEVVFSPPSFQFQESSPLVAEQELKAQEERVLSEAQGEEHVVDTLFIQTEEGRESEAASFAEAEYDEDNDEGEMGSGVMVTTRDDDELENTTMATKELELANTDELNRKFEEFIRKMKEEIRIEAQRQPIAV